MTSAATRVLVLGGYGTFGGRLLRLLADDERLSLIVAGRSLEKAQAFCVRHRGKADMQPADFDRDGDPTVQLALLAPAIVVDASGPFQAYGDDPYRMVRACIAEGIHYLDLADGLDFVAGVSAFDGEAKRWGVFVLSGMSTLPVLSSLVVRRLSVGLDMVETVATGIAPSPHAGVGLNVVRAIASYAGKPVALRRDGEDVTAHGLTDILTYTVAPPGALPLAPRVFSLVEAPDLAGLPRQWPGIRSVWVGAGPAPGLLHAVLRGFARLVRLGVIRSLSGMAGLMHWATRHLRWGEHRGGMFVEVSGKAGDGRPLRRSWHLIAEGDDGPFIPSIAAAAIIRNMLEGRVPAPGARAGINDLSLADYERSFEKLAVRTGIRRSEDEEPGACLYRRVLGEAMDRLPAPIAGMHEVHGTVVAEGIGEVERGRGPLAALAGLLIGFPPAGRNVPVRVTFTPADGAEAWERDFGGHIFLSTQEVGRGRFEGLVVERFGPVAVGLAMVEERGRLKVISRRWSVFGVPMPRFLLPQGPVWESAEDGRFNFHVEIGMPLLGTFVRYRGWLVRRN
jgi:hypothetical protein